MAEASMKRAVQDEDLALDEENEDTQANKYLFFKIGQESYGIGIRHIIEIIELQTISAVPDMPDYVKGVINLRGKVVPLIDLRLKFGMPAAEYTTRTCIIVTQARTESGAVLMGIVVDGVSEVLNLTGQEIEDTPDFGRDVASQYLLGMAKVKGKVKILLDIDKVLSSQEVNDLDSMLAK